MSGTCLSLALDYDTVMSGWEEIGGNIFGPDPSASPFDDNDEEPLLDLSFTGADDKGASGANDYGFLDLFSPAEMGLAFYPGPPEAGSSSTWSQPGLVPGSEAAPKAGSTTDLMVVPSFDFDTEQPTLPQQQQQQQQSPVWLSQDASSPSSGATAATLPAAGPVLPGGVPQASQYSLQLDCYGFPDSAGSPSLAFMPNGLPSMGDGSVVYSSAGTTPCYGSNPYGVAGAALTASGAATAAQRAAWAAFPSLTRNSSSAAPTYPRLSGGASMMARGVGCGGAFGVAAGEPEVRTRADCLERYRAKKARRLYTKTIRYQLRKINADNRPRIKGRFVKKDEGEDLRTAAVARGACFGVPMVCN